MMKNNDISNLTNTAIKNILQNCSNNKKIQELIKKQNQKIHFIPRNYRIFGGLLQSMNIQFGNFLEEFMTLLIKNNDKYQIEENYSGKKNNEFKISTENETRIDNFISRCQMNITDFNLDDEFKKLLNEIQNDTCKHLSTVKHDIDILFEEKENKKLYYLEVKYNDDHDTGKFVDINRKIIKTYAYLVKEFPKRTIIPILFFFNNKRMKGNIYLPEQTNIRRGKQFFDEFLDIKYEDVESFMKNFSESSENLEVFENLYKKIIKLK